MPTILTVGAALGAAVTMACLFQAAGYDSDSTWAFSLWAAGPYLGLCWLALAFRRNRDASRLVLAGTLFIGAGALLLFYNYLRPYINTSPGDANRPMNCVGPIAEYGVPIIQWFFVGVLGLAARWAGAPAPPEIVFQDGEHE
jgi:hypothetical protein